MIHVLGKGKEKMQEVLTRDPEELKHKLTEMNSTLGEINSRINESGEQVSDLEDRMVEVTAVK